MTAQHRTKNTAAHNMGFAIAGVPCFAGTFVQGGSSVLRMKFSAKTPRHRKPPKRYASCYDDQQQLTNRQKYANI